MPRVSVVIPTYNRASVLGRAIRSIIAQSFNDFELIIVDDCSTDNTFEVVRSIGDSRVRCVMQLQNSGAQAARNRGILEAKGDWIAFQDSDDEWMPEKLERQVTALERCAYDSMTVVHTDCWRFDQELGQKIVWSLPLVNGPDVFDQLLTSPGPLFPSVLTSRKALDRIGLLDERVPSFQEWDTAIRLSRICHFIHIREPLFVYHLHAGETISKDKQRDLEGYQYIVDKFSNEIIAQCGKEVFLTHLVINALKALRYGFRNTALDFLERGQTRGMKGLSFLCRRGADQHTISRAFHTMKRFHLL